MNLYIMIKLVTISEAKKCAGRENMNKLFWLFLGMLIGYEIAKFELAIWLYRHGYRAGDAQKIKALIEEGIL